MTKLADWLNGFDHITAVTPMTVTIGSATYEACSYVARFETLEGSSAYDNGERHYNRSLIYCLGKLPSCYLRSSRHAFLINDDPADWFISSYFPAIQPRRQAAGSRQASGRRQADVQPTDFHPFGATFMLSPWDSPCAIDEYESRPYRRLRISVTREV